jgi:uncharacterized protein VirK/YbjX
VSAVSALTAGLDEDSHVHVSNSAVSDSAKGINSSNDIINELTEGEEQVEVKEISLQQHQHEHQQQEFIKPLTEVASPLSLNIVAEEVKEEKWILALRFEMRYVMAVNFVFHPQRLLPLIPH